MQETRSTCCYCGVGCGVIVQTEGDRVVGVRGDPDHPSNFGRLCSKGASLHLTTGLEGRVLYPELRLGRGSHRRRASFAEALDLCAERFAGIIREHGPDSVGFYVSGQLLTEDYYVFNKLAKGLIGTNNIDTNSRLCMSSAVSAYKASLGVDAPPCCYEDLGLADCVLIAGANPAYAHPVLFRRLEDAKAANPELKIIVVDPRRTDSCSLADLHLPLLPGTDVALFNAMLHVLIWDGLIDGRYIRSHTEGFEALKATVREYTPAAVAATCGLDAADIVRAALCFGSAAAALSLYCQGLNQSSRGTDKNRALINLHLATGHIGRPGAGPFSLTGQPNAMGGREAGGMANLLPGHRDLADPDHRAEIARLWGVPQLPAQPGATAVEMFEAARQGRIKALWIACTDPAHSLPDLGLVREALDQAEFVVVQEAFAGGETATYADVLLPAATWPEKDGTMTNSERRVSRVHAARPAPGEARADWEIAAEFARRLESRLAPFPGECLAPFPGECLAPLPLEGGGAGGEGGRCSEVDAASPSPPTPSRQRGVTTARSTLFPYGSPEEIFNDHRETTRGRDLDITGLSYARLDARGPQQWPFPDGATEGRPRLYEDAVFPTPSGRARFADVAYAPLAESTDARYPLHLNTGRSRDQWHGMSRSGRVARLYAHAEEPRLAMHPDDMARRGLKDGDFARLRSRRGELVVPVQASADLRAAQVFLPMHWSRRHMAGAGSNALTLAALDPVSRQPELKHAAVQVEKLELPWRLVAIARGQALERGQAVRELLADFEYAACGLHGMDEPLLVVRAAGTAPAAAGTLAQLDQLLGLQDEACALVYRDARRGIDKRVAVADGAVVAARLAGDTAGAEALKERIAQGLDAEQMRAWLLAPAAAEPLGRVVCSCMNVRETAIMEAAKAGANMAELQESLKCGSVCGSCRPEVQRLVGVARSAAGTAEPLSLRRSG